MTSMRRISALVVTRRNSTESIDNANAATRYERYGVACRRSDGMADAPPRCRIVGHRLPVGPIVGRATGIERIRHHAASATAFLSQGVHHVAGTSCRGCRASAPSSRWNVAAVDSSRRNWLAGSAEIRGTQGRVAGAPARERATGA